MRADDLQAIGAVLDLFELGALKGADPVGALQHVHLHVLVHFSMCMCTCVGGGLAWEVPCACECKARKGSPSGGTLSAAAAQRWAACAPSNAAHPVTWHT